MKKNKVSKGVVRKILTYVRSYYTGLFFSFLCAALTVLLTLYIPIAVGEAIDHIIEPGKVHMDIIVNILIKVAVAAILAALIQWIQGVINNKITFGIVRNLRSAAFSKLQQLPVSYSDTNAHGDIVSRIITDADQFSDGLLMGFSQLFTGLITIIGTLAFMFVINWKIAIVVVLVTPLSLFAASFIARRTHNLFSAQAKIRGEQTAYINEIIGNEKVVRAYGHEAQAIETFEGMNKELEKCSLKAVFFSSLVNPATRVVNSVVYAGVGLVGALSVIANPVAFTVGSLSVFLSYANQYTKPFNEISGVVTELQNAMACAERLLELVEKEPQTPDKPNAKTLTNAKGNIDIRNISFSYTEDKPLIRDFSVCVPHGSRVAIVGPTGCGKTTLIGLLMRFYDVDDGEILVDSADIRNITRTSLRRSYGMVLQDTWIKTATVRENITIGKPDATEAEIIAAAKASHAHSFIKRLPKGYDTVISDDSGLSQGQKQLLCITRVMLALPPMLILDEATSSIDTRTEMRIQNAFATMMQGRTSFIVAHRLSTIREADMILVMNDGQIIETGTHESLLAQNGFYANLYNSQFKQ
ncbi:MAG: ABC transporter ATP-binding protein [Ruminococcaceae bacterium]|nr:ABC transporter ATP-binding protein [Oscillospiraceae bacterium]